MTNEQHEPDDVIVQGVDAFFEKFDAAFASFSGAIVAARYAEPYLACRADGGSTALARREDTARYFQDVLDDSARLGVRTCRHRDVAVVDVGAGHHLGTVTWDLLDGVGQTVVSWRESYLW